jgi:Flp pilus assembly protein TadG
MAATIQTSATYNGSASVTHSINLPTGIQNGDKLIAIICMASGDFDLGSGPTLAGFVDFSGNSGHGLSAGDGYSVITDTVAVLAYERDADGTEGSTATYNTQGTDDEVAAVVVRISGHTSGTPDIADNTTGGTDLDPPNLAPAGGSAEYLWLGGGAVDGGQSISSFPTNYTEVATATETSQVTATLAERTLTASSENPGAFNHTNTDWAAITIAVGPGVTTLVADAGSYSWTGQNADLKRPATSFIPGSVRY